jgi:hypothetical protein
MSSCILRFGLIVISLAAYVVRKNIPSYGDVLRLFGTIVIIVISVFLVVAGYDDKQMAPVMGLLGTIDGSLLGKDSRLRGESNS